MAEKFDKIREELKDQYIKNLDFNLKNMIYKDNLIAKYIYTENKPKKDINFEDLIKEVVLFFSRLQSKTNKISVMDAVIKSSEIEDELIVDTLFKYNKYSLTPFSHQNLNKSNTLALKGNLGLFNLRFPQFSTVDNPPHIDTNIREMRLILEDELSLGIDYKHDTLKKGIFLQNTLFLMHNFEYMNKLKFSNSHQDIKRNKDQRTFKACLSKSFYQRPFVFRENLIFDPVTKLNIQYAHKIIENIYDESNSSLEMKTEVPHEDSLHQLKVSFVSCGFKNFKNFLHNQNSYIANSNINNASSTFFKISSSLNQTVNNSFVENKLFLRQFFNFEKLLVYQFNIEGGLLLQTNIDKKLKLPENFFIKNFKGIYNPGEKVIVEEGKTGDCLGNNYYLAIKNKLIYNNVPIINNYTLQKDNFEIAPFVFFNVLICGNTNLRPNKEYDRLHYTTGFGLNVLTDAFNIELYYNLFIKKNKFDIGREFGFNIGLD